MVKKIFLVIIFISFTACEKITDDVVNPQTMTVSLIALSAPENFTYSETNTDLVTSLELSSTGQLNLVWFIIKTEDGSAEISDSVFMWDDGNTQTTGDQATGDNIYTGKFTFDSEMANGKYLIEYYIEDNVNYEPDNIRLVASCLFDYLSSAPNEPPVISDLNIRSSVSRGTVFAFSVKASDPNGSADIARVYYELYKPDGTIQSNSQGITQFPMFDNGDSANTGDQTAGDGIYSFKLTFPADVAAGTWQFKFHARDNAGELSNEISHNIEVN